MFIPSCLNRIYRVRSVSTGKRSLAAFSSRLFACFSSNTIMEIGEMLIQEGNVRAVKNFLVCDGDVFHHRQGTGYQQSCSFGVILLHLRKCNQRSKTVNNTDAILFLYSEEKIKWPQALVISIEEG
jgi:hypothetical protein